MTNVLDEVTKLLGEAKLKLMSLVTDNAPEVLAAINGYVANAGERFADLLDAMRTGSDAKFLLMHLQFEKGILESEVLSFIVIGKQVIQDAINGIQDLILDAVRAVLPNN